MRVSDRECDLGRRAAAHETCDPDGVRIAVDVTDEHVVIRIYAGQLRELDVGQTRLGAAEAPFARALTETCEECGDRPRVAVAERSDREAVDKAGVHMEILNAPSGPKLPLDGPSF